MPIQAPHRPGRDTWPAEIAVLTGLGVFFALAGLFDTDRAPLALSLIYWCGLMVAGGSILIAVDTALGRFAPRPLAEGWTGFAGLVLIAGTLQTGVVAFFEVALMNHPPQLQDIPYLWPPVLLVMLVAAAAMRVFRTVLRLRRQSPGEAGSHVRVPALLAERMAPGLRRSPLIALSAEDHYVRVHTRAGSALVLIRFGDALKLVGQQPGHKVHRSWWVATDAIDTAAYSRGRGEIRLSTGLTVPVSRSYAETLRGAGILPRRGAASSSS
ncbi:LytTR family DNA-binding domain-containing protein [Maricaulis sp.]|uniref:LytTR family DNA-binding domain-containing protein n=1 Tax=Maricaulis sp. TaxID=1486257 RepID=UPI00261F9472|nr:LytTR family DNA-binding domain-containing protein [Maricaulis sp.]